MAIQNITQDDDLDVKSEVDVDDHLSILRRRLSETMDAKTRGYEQANAMRRKGFADFIAKMSASGHDVSSPEKLQAFLGRLAQHDPDLSQGIMSSVHALLPDANERDHVNGESLSHYILKGATGQPAAAQPAEQSADAQPAEPQETPTDAG